jgi:hypothetical protein
MIAFSARCARLAGNWSPDIRRGFPSLALQVLPSKHALTRSASHHFLGGPGRARSSFAVPSTEFRADVEILRCLSLLGSVGATEGEMKTRQSPWIRQGTDPASTVVLELLWE